MNAPTCDEHPEHGPMTAEHIYHIDGTISADFGMYWFCHLPDCNGYGGPVHKEKTAKSKKQTDEQLSMFAEPLE